MCAYGNTKSTIWEGQKWLVKETCPAQKKKKRIMESNNGFSLWFITSILEFVYIICDEFSYINIVGKESHADGHILYINPCLPT